VFARNERMLASALLSGIDRRPSLTPYSVQFPLRKQLPIGASAINASSASTTACCNAFYMMDLEPGAYVPVGEVFPSSHRARLERQGEGVAAGSRGSARCVDRGRPAYRELLAKWKLTE